MKLKIRLALISAFIGLLIGILICLSVSPVSQTLTPDGVEKIVITGEEQGDYAVYKGDIEEWKYNSDDCVLHFELNGEDMSVYIEETDNVTFIQQRGVL